MPNPLSKVRPHASIAFNDTSLAKRPELAIEIGNTLADWARLDARIGGIFTRLMDTDEKGAVIYGALISGGAQEQVLDAVANLQLGKDELDLFAAIRGITRRPRDQRNNLAHGSWGYTEELPDALLWVSPRELVRLYQRADAFVRDLQPGKLPLPNLPGLDRDQVLVYRKADFTAIRQQIGEAFLAWQDFAAIYLPMWEAKLPIAEVEAARRRLFGNPDIRGRIDKARQNRGEPPLPPLEG